MPGEFGCSTSRRRWMSALCSFSGEKSENPMAAEEGRQGRRHGSESPAFDPASRRADAQDLSFWQKIRQQLDDPWHAWYLLFVSILAVVTQLLLRIMNEAKPGVHALGEPHRSVPLQGSAEHGGKQHLQPSAARTRVHHTLQQALSTFSKRMLELQEQVPGKGQASVEARPIRHGCDPYDEPCHARMLDFSEAVSYHQDTTLFYTELKDWVLYMIFLVSIFAFSAAGLRRYQRRRWTSQPLDQEKSLNHGARPAHRTWAEQDAEWMEDDGLPFALCAVSVAVALGSVLLVPMTILDGLLRNYVSGQDLYGGLASTDLGFIWHMLFYVSAVCHFVVLPFAFLYTESEVLSKATYVTAGKVFWSRLKETSVTLLLILALLALLVQVLEMLQVPLMQTQRLTLSYIVTSMQGSLIFLLLVPFGFEGYICLAIRRAQRKIMSRESVHDLELETSHLLEADAQKWAAWRQQHHHHHQQQQQQQHMQQHPQEQEASIPSPPLLPRKGSFSRLPIPATGLGGVWGQLTQHIATLYSLGLVLLTQFEALAVVLLSLALPATVLLRVVVYQVLDEQSQLPLSLLLGTGAVPHLARDLLYACLDCILVTYVWKSTWRGLDSLPYLSTW
jgi:hypothetical protein